MSALFNSVSKLKKKITQKTTTKKKQEGKTLWDPIAVEIQVPYRPSETERYLGEFHSHYQIVEGGSPDGVTGQTTTNHQKQNKTSRYTQWQEAV
ncbi:hypothetical protein F8M41_024173 [Gigaspora margarita]|uniref:Uncharacterized protein n=1 Tax=Gigaspora margarita TaxID=4874 RepID=A0A8H4AC53_GIGMA|nr:hypothetical protein F8M41_024173 [Gigaspora margarita]